MPMPLQIANSRALLNSRSLLGSVPWVAQWKFNNDGSDSVGSNTLTNNNSATFTTGLLGGATGATNLASASSQYWSIADNAALSMGSSDFTIAQWIYANSLPSSPALVTKWNGATSNSEYATDAAGASNAFRFYVSNNGTTANVLTSGTSLTTGAWILIVAWHDSVAQTINMQINNGAVESKAHTTGVFDGVAALRIGTRDISSDFFNGRLRARVGKQGSIRPSNQDRV